MSCDEWERGTWVLPATEYRKFRTTILTKHNGLQDRLLSQARDMVERLRSDGKGKRYHPFRQRAEAMLSGLRDGFDYAEEWQHVIFDVIFPNGARKPKMPTRKDFPLVVMTKSCLLDYIYNDLTISLTNKDRTVIWTVHEGNHACEHARAHPIATTFFDALSRVQWTTRTGGKIVGNDENHRDDARFGDEDNGGNYTKGTWGNKKPKF